MILIHILDFQDHACLWYMFYFIFLELSSRNGFYWAHLEFAFFRLAFWLLFALFTVKFTRFLRKFIDYLETKSVDFCPKMTWSLIDLVVNSRLSALSSHHNFQWKVRLYLHLLASFYHDTSVCTRGVGSWVAGGAKGSWQGGLRVKIDTAREVKSQLL